jgi:uncharacterized membrane protein
VFPRSFERLPHFRALLRSHFLSGLLVVVPIGVIVWLLWVVARALWGLQDLVPLSWKPGHPTVGLLFSAALTLGCLVLLALGISFVGWVSNQLLGQKLLELLSDHVIKRIPVLRSVYHALDQLMRAIASGGGHQFSRVVYIDYPRKGVLALAFVIGPAKGPAVPPGHLNIYVPTTPNPTSGFHLLVPETDVYETRMTVEEAFRTILSLGIAQPDVLPRREP